MSSARKSLCWSLLDVSVALGLNSQLGLLKNSDCYCASSLASTSETSSGVCNLPCPGNPLEICGGTVPTSGKLRRRNVPAGEDLEVYAFNPPTTTTSSSSETSTTSSSTSDQSSDPEPTPEKRNIQADMEVSQRISREVKLRRGGMLRNPRKAIKAPGLAKRDYGLKQIFGV